MISDEIERRIRSFPHWLYEFELDGHRTPVTARQAARHPKRRRHFFDALVAFMGGSLSGSRVLDLGSNAGYWSLAAIEAGADRIVGIEGRKMHVNQAEFVFETRRVDPARYRFLQGDFLETDFRAHGTFDVVLCLGVLYHLSRPIEFLERIAGVNTDVLLIDSRLSTLPGALLELRRESTQDPRNAIGSGLVMEPTRQAVCEMARELGYQVAVLKPEFADPAGVDDYVRGARRAFLCAKHRDLSQLRVPVEPVERLT